MPAKRTVDCKGAKNVVINNTGNDKAHFTVVLLCCADGTTLPPFIIFKGSSNGTNIKKVRQQVEEKELDVYITFQKNGWMDSTVMVHEWAGYNYLNSCRLVSKSANSFSSSSSSSNIYNTNSNFLDNRSSNQRLHLHRKLLLLDSFSAHLKDSVKAAIKGKTNVDLAVVPGGYTSLLQPLDVGIIKPFKDGYRRRWHHWMLSNAFSNINKLKRPDYLTVCQWVSESWEDLRMKAVIPNSFRRALDLKNTVE